MNEPMEKYFKMGIVHFMAFPELAGGQGPWEETVRQICLDPFFTAIEITHIHDQTIRERVKKMIDLAGLSVGFGAHPIILGQKLNLNSLDEAERLRALGLLKPLIDEALFMGAESFVLLSGKDPGEDKRDQAVEALARSLSELCDYSAKKGGPMVVAEIFDCSVDKCCLLGPTSLALKLAQRMKQTHNNFGLLVDLSHIPLLKESPEEALVPVKDYLAGAHIGNAVVDPACAGYGDNHPIFGSPGSANTVRDVAEFLKTLLRIGFMSGEKRPLISFEIKPLEGQDPLIIIANAKRVMAQAWAGV
jgi:sugar phosphate isomerase/epimerase